MLTIIWKRGVERVGHNHCSVSLWKCPGGFMNHVEDYIGVW